MVNFQKWVTIAWTTLYHLPIDDMFLVISDPSLYFVLVINLSQRWSTGSNKVISLSKMVYWLNKVISDQLVHAGQVSNASFWSLVWRSETMTCPSDCLCMCTIMYRRSVLIVYWKHVFLGFESKLHYCMRSVCTFKQTPITIKTQPTVYIMRGPGYLFLKRCASTRHCTDQQDVAHPSP